MPVKELSLSLLKHAEVANVAKEVCTTFDTVTDAVPIIVRMCDEVKGYITKLENRTGQSVKNMLVEPLAEADEERDWVHRGIVNFVDGARHHPVDEKLADAGVVIYNVLQSHNLRLYKESYSVESHLLDALFVDIDKPEYAPALETLELKSSLDKLKESQKKFAQLHIDKSKVSSELTLTQISEYVNPIRKVLYQMLEALDAAERYEPAKYGAVVAHINELIATYNAQGRSRKTRKQNEAEKATPAPVAAV